MEDWCSIQSSMTFIAKRCAASPPLMSTVPRPRMFPSPRSAHQRAHTSNFPAQGPGWHDIEVAIQHNIGATSLAAQYTDDVPDTVNPGLVNPDLLEFGKDCFCNLSLAAGYEEMQRIYLIR